MLISGGQTVASQNYSEKDTLDESENSFEQRTDIQESMTTRS